MASSGSSLHGAAKESRLERPSKPLPKLQAVTSDNLAGQYSSMVGGGGSAAEKEASMLMSVAEGHLAEDQSFDEALHSAEEALRLFTEAKNSKGMADSQRLIVIAHRAKADAARYSADPAVRSSAEGDLAKAEQMAVDELTKAKASNDKRAQACMLLAHAEVLSEKREASAVAKALPLAKEACAIFADVDDKRMEAIASEQLAHLCIRHCDYSEAKARANKAAAILEELDEKTLLAKALNSKGYIHYCAGDPAAGLDAAKASLAKYTELGQKKGQAMQQYLIAQLMLLKPSSKRQALTPAKEAAAMFLQLKSGKSWEAAALVLQARAHLARDELMEASRALTDGAVRFKQEGDRRSEVMVLDMLVQVYLQQESYNQAHKAADDAQAASIELKDKVLESICTSVKAEIHLEEQDWDQAETVAKKAASIADALKDSAEAAAVKDVLVSVLFARKDYAEAVRVANQQRDVYKDCGEQAKEAFALMNAALAESMEQEPGDGIELAYEAELLARRSKDKRALAAALRVLSRMHMVNGSYDGALRSARQSRSLWQEMGEEVEEVNTLRSICEILLFRGRPVDCITWATEGEEIANKIGYELGQCEMYLLIASGNLHTLIKDGEKAKDVYGTFKKRADLVMAPADNALSIAEKLNNKALQASAKLTLAQGLLYSEKIDPAIKACKEAEALFTDLEDKSGQGFSAALSSEAFFIQDKESDALANARRALDIARELKENVLAERAGEVVTKITGEKVGVALDDDTDAGRTGASSVAVAGAESSGMDPEVVRMLVFDMAKASTGLDEGDLTMDAPLMEVGMDSLSSVQFRNDLVKETGLALPSSLMFDYPSMREITEQIVEMTKAAEGGGEDGQEAGAAEAAGGAKPAAAAEEPANRMLDFGMPVSALPAFGREYGVGYYQPGFYRN